MYDITGGKKLISSGTKGTNIISDVSGNYPLNIELKAYSAAAPYICLFGKQRIAWHNVPPTLVAASNQNSWRQGDVIWNSAAAAGQPAGWMCVTSGTFSAAAATGGITNGTTLLTVDATRGFNIGDYIKIAGVTGIFEVLDIEGLVLTLDGKVDATVAGAAVAAPDPVFEAMANLGA